MKFLASVAVALMVALALVVYHAAMKPGELRPWIQKNLRDLEMDEEKARIRLNEVVFDLNVPASIE